jgi:bile acid:Na+ symporter, BASS family
MGWRDALVFIMILGSSSVAVLLPSFGSLFHPFLVPLVMVLLFFSFLRIDFSALLDTSRKAMRQLVVLGLLKLVGLPTALFFLFQAALPDYAIPVLLLSGISTGVVAPFIATLVAANVAAVLRLVVVTSLLVPFTLPALVKILAGAEMHIPLESMVSLLAQVIFLPLAAVICLRRLAPHAVQTIMRYQFPASLTLISLTNLGVFSKYSAFFFHHPGQLLVSIAVAYVLSASYYAAGFLVSFRDVRADRLAAGVSLATMNNVLVIVFAAEFFGPLAPTLATMYMFPFYTMVVPVNFIAARMK